MHFRAFKRILKVLFLGVRNSRRAIIFLNFLRSYYFFSAPYSIGARQVKTKNYYYRYNLVFKNGYSANIESSSGVNGVEKFLGS